MTGARRKALSGAVACLALVAAVPGCAQDRQPSASAPVPPIPDSLPVAPDAVPKPIPPIARPAPDQGFATWLEGLKVEAAGQGVSQPLLDSVLAGLQPMPRVIELDRAQPEVKLTVRQYLQRVVTQRRIADARDRYRQHRALLNKIERQYGVPGRFLVALWGVESSFGRNTGGFPVLASLATLAYDGRRQELFRSELIQALRILQAGHVSPERMIGSWAGAMGQVQFMPSTFARHAVDQDGDGRIDVWNDLPDVFASAANYLKAEGWKGDQGWGREVRLPARFDPALAGREPAKFKTLSEWHKLGVRRSDGGPLPGRGDMMAGIIRPDGGPDFMVYGNYNVLMAWNRSNLFALSIGRLADAIQDNAKTKGPGA